MKKIGIVGKLSLVSTLLVMFSVVSILTVGYFVNYNHVNDAAGKELIGCASITTKLANPTQLAAIKTGDMSGLEEMQQSINWIVDHKDIFLNAAIMDLDGRILVPDRRLEAQGFQAGDMFYVDKEAVQMLKQMKHPTYSEIYTFGGITRKTGYAPIFMDHNPSKEIIGLMTVDFEERIIKERTYTMLEVTILIGFIFPILAGIIGYLYARKIAKPIIDVTHNMDRFAAGDLTLVELEVKSKDEVGKLTEGFNSMVHNIKGTITELAATTSSLRSSAEDLLHVSDSMAMSSRQTSDKTSLVRSASEQITTNMELSTNSLASTSTNISMIASAVEEMSGTIRNLASASEQTSVGVKEATVLVAEISGSIGKVSESASEVSNSVNNVVLAVKEINHSLNEVSRNCSSSIQITTDAGIKAKETNAIIEKLNLSSKQIGKIVNVINDIADQTNMLALNAAIEAAGAGEAGKGFAVVANEVKELAKQTAEATDEISQQIENMQDKMNEAVTAVSGITEVIQGITSITNTIASAVAEQTATIGEISNSSAKSAERVNHITVEIVEISKNARNVRASVEESSKGVTEIAKSAVELSKASGDVAMNTEQVSNSVVDLTDNTKEISREISQIAGNIQLIDISGNEVSAAASSTNGSAKSLTVIASKLDELVKKFKL